MTEQTTVLARDDYGELDHGILTYAALVCGTLDKHLQAIYASALTEMMLEERRTESEDDQDTLLTCLYGLNLYHLEMAEEFSSKGPTGFSGLSSTPQ